MKQDEIKPGVTYTAENGDRDRTVVRIETVTAEMAQRGAHVPVGERQVLYTISGPFQFSPFTVSLAEFAEWAVSLKEPEAAESAAL